MARIAAGNIVITEVFDGADGVNPDVQNWVFQDALSAPSTPADSAGVPTGWTDSAPASPTNLVWSVLGIQTAGTGNFSWGTVVQITGSDGANGTDGTDGVDGTNGTNGTNGSNGVDGTRGPGRFSANVTLGNTTIPSIGSTDYNADAREGMCVAVGGTWTSSCSDSLGDPVAGDIMVVTYTDSVGDTFTRGGIHDGTGVADNDWSGFDLQIDGNLLVSGTVVADTINMDTANISGTLSAANIEASGLTIDSSQVTNLPSGGGGGGAAAWAAGSYDADDQVYHNGNIFVANTTTSDEPPSADWDALVGTADTTASSRLEVSSDKIEIYSGGVLRVLLGNLA